MGRAYHRTDAPAAAAILAGGFEDRDGRWGTGELRCGVWLTWDKPWDLAVSALATGVEPALIVVDLPERTFTEYEWVQKHIGYREALLPAEVVNRYPRWLAWECDGCGRVEPERTQAWTRQRHPGFGVLVTLCGDCG